VAVVVAGDRGEGGEDLVGEAGAVGVGDGRGADADDDLVGVDLLERDVRLAAHRRMDGVLQERLHVARRTSGRRRARRSTAAGSRSGTTAALRTTLLGTMIESCPCAKVVQSSPSEATTPSSWPASPPACRPAEQRWRDEAAHVTRERPAEDHHHDRGGGADRRVGAEQLLAAQVREHRRGDRAPAVSTRVSAITVRLHQNSASCTPFARRRSAASAARSRSASAAARRRSPTRCLKRSG
jgi:hypothetical protein